MIAMNPKIREIISYYKLSDRQFAIKIGVTQSVIGSMFQKGAEPSSKIIQLTAAAFPELSLDWLIRDEGDMFKNTTKESMRIERLIDTITTLQDTINIKSETISILTERVKQLELKLNSK